MSSRRIANYVKSSLKGVVDTSFNAIVETVDSFQDSLSYSPKLRRKNSGKIDAVRRVFKYESLVFHGWRSIWCTYITIIAFYNFQRMKGEFADTYAGANTVPYHAHYDRKTSWDIMMVIAFFSIDLLIYLIRRKFMTRSIIIHHLLGIFLSSIALISKYPHHYHANLFMLSEMVSCLTVMSHYARKSRSRTMYKLYLLQYLLLTIFGRGWIWYTISTDLLQNDVGIFCYFGILPLILMDAIWSRQCIQGLMK
jgi:hypothetical protein